jgi:hypothetical protein
MFFIRMYHECILGESWNNMPVVITWGWTVVFAGATIFFVGLGTEVAVKCDGGCERVDGSSTWGTMVSGGIVFFIGLCMAYCWCCARQQQEPDPWGNADADVREDKRGCMSGVDFVLLGIGLSVLAAEQSIGDCPLSCATPAHG